MKEIVSRSLFSLSVLWKLRPCARCEARAQIIIERMRLAREGKQKLIQRLPARNCFYCGRRRQTYPLRGALLLSDDDDHKTTAIEREKAQLQGVTIYIPVRLKSQHKLKSKSVDEMFPL